MDQDPILANLNEAQHEAVVAPLSGQYQILAGPGTGKTKTLTSRVAYLMNTVPAKDILVMTFTNAAAREMRSRIKQLIPNNNEVSKLNVGTFHGECFKYLVRYGSRIGLSGKITIADPTDQAAIMKEIVNSAETTVKLEEFGYSSKLGKCYSNPTTKMNINLDPKHCIKKISEFKSHGYTEVQDFAKVCPNEFNSPIGMYIYRKYQDELEENGLVDFDDIIIKTRDLLKQCPDIVSNIQAVLVDEFQDSSTVQLELTVLFAKATGNITIVGDPDQSIYAFRNAQPENMRLLQKMFPNSKVIYLEENYRSTQPILDIAVGLIRRDRNRIGGDRLLKSQDSQNTTKKSLPVLAQFKSEKDEAAYVATQIKYLRDCSGTLFKYQDMAILARTGYASKKCELELAFNGIPYRVLGGFKFWDRAEVKLVVDYFRVVNSDNDRVAISSTINAPKRGFGPVTLTKLLTRVDDKTSIFTQLKQYAYDEEFREEHGLKIRKDALEGLDNYIKLIEGCRDILKEADALGPATCIRNILDHILEKTNLVKILAANDANNEEKRLENIELIRSQIDLVYQNDEMNDDGGAAEEDLNPLQTLLLSLSLGGDGEDSAYSNDRVTISTMHSAKGLEWPIVFSINTIDDHVARGGDKGEEEERRLLFVSLTRAKLLLYVSFATTLVKFGNEEEASMTRLLTGLEHHFKTCDKGKGTTNISWDMFVSYANFLRRPVPDRKQIQFASSATTVPSKSASFSGFTLASSVIERPQNKKRKPHIPSAPISRSLSIPTNNRTSLLNTSKQTRATGFRTPLMPSKPTPTLNSPNTLPHSHPIPPKRKTLGTRRGPINQKLPFT
ncbi:DNA helicase SRS2 [Sugiyamaella lignohabitans]|uniref:DNA 3'-5' helicase n=1 Tax=Sugiyamaella lignohabitans TaxID=796027 RepID=A0A167DCU4_9ASCO|nr:DNA helicase SRS2 [Sugiyamaella lignohabitans]ANB12772.1 DNA helicase SRS2 [Sugiyamaella lignohabitans]